MKSTSAAATTFAVTTLTTLTTSVEQPVGVHAWPPHKTGAKARHPEALWAYTVPSPDDYQVPDSNLNL